MANRRDTLINVRSEPVANSLRDSSVYQAILEDGRQEGRVEGAIEEARKVLLMVGSRSAWAGATSKMWIDIAKIDDLDRLEWQA